MAIPIQFLLAESTFPTTDIKGNDYLIPDFQLLYIQSYFLYNTDKFVSECCTNTRIRYESVVQMQVGTTDAGTCNADDRIAGMLNPGHWLMAVRSDPIRASIIHC